MSKRVATLFSIGLMVICSPMALAYNKGKITPRLKAKVFNLKKFDNVYVKDGLHVKLENGRRYQVIVSRPKDLPAPVLIQTKDNNLTLSWEYDGFTKQKTVYNHPHFSWQKHGMPIQHLVGPEDKAHYHPDQVKITVKAPSIKKVVLYDTTTVFSKRFKCKDLTIVNQESGYVDLNGMIGLKQIIQNSARPIKVNWVDNSNNIQIDATGKGAIELAGEAKHIRATLHKRSYMDSRYLRAKDMWVQTKDRSHADVLATNFLAAFAFGTNNISYYKTPAYLIEETSKLGNVLQKGFWN